MIDTTWFYAPPENFREARVKLPEREAHHVTSVLRGGAGEEIIVVDGEGGCFRVHLEEVRHEHVVGRVLEERRGAGEPTYDLTVAIGILKKRSRFETFLEKAVELGVGRIIPLITDHGEKETIRRDRAQRILTAGLKQTRRSRLPVLEAPQSTDELIDSSAADLRIVCHGDTREARPLARCLPSVVDREIVAAVGPAGGFSGREITTFVDRGWKLADLGARRLRTETAGIVVAASAHAVWSLEELPDG